LHFDATKMGLLLFSTTPFISLLKGFFRFCKF
jgi:hypothetical protein